MANGAIGTNPDRRPKLVLRIRAGRARQHIQMMVQQATMIDMILILDLLGSLGQPIGTRTSAT